MLAGTVMVLLLASCDTSYLEAPERLGPPSVVLHENGPRLWLLVQQEEFKQRTIGLSRRTSGTSIREVFYHSDLQAHDTRTTAKLWKTRLLTAEDKEISGPVLTAKRARPCPIVCTVSGNPRRPRLSAWNIPPKTSLSG